MGEALSEGGVLCYGAAWRSKLGSARELSSRRPGADEELRTDGVRPAAAPVAQRTIPRDRASGRILWLRSQEGWRSLGSSGLLWRRGGHNWRIGAEARRVTVDLVEFGHDPAPFPSGKIVTRQTFSDISPCVVITVGMTE